MASNPKDQPEPDSLEEAKKKALNLFEEEERRAARKGKTKADADGESSAFGHLGG